LAERLALGLEVLLVAIAAAVVATAWWRYRERDIG
jgi:hypothetical protein